MVGGQGAGRIWKAWPEAGGIERVVQDEPFIRHHRDPDLFVLAGADTHHAAMNVERKAGRLAVRPEGVNGREIEVATPGMVCKGSGKDGIQATTIAKVHDEVEEMRTHGRNDVGSEGVDDEIWIDLEAMSAGQQAECGVDVVSCGETTEGSEGDGVDGGVVEEGDMIVSVEVYAMVVDGGLYIALLGSIVCRETLRDVRGIVWHVVGTVIDEGIVIMVSVRAKSQRYDVRDAKEEKDDVPEENLVCTADGIRVEVRHVGDGELAGGRAKRTVWRVDGTEWEREAGRQTYVRAHDTTLIRNLKGCVSRRMIELN